MTQTAEVPPEVSPEDVVTDTGPPLAADATIHQRISRVLAELPAIGKDQWNEQQKFHFRGYDDVLNALNPLLGEHGIFFVPAVVERVVGERTTRSGSTMYEVNLHVRFRFYGLAGDYVEASGWGEGTDMGDKATNKAMTMALKYVLFQVFAISTEEAADSDRSAPEETTREGGGTGSQPPTESQPPAEPPYTLETAIEDLQAYVEDARPWIKEAVKAMFDIDLAETKFSELAEAQRIELLKGLKAAVTALHAVQGEAGQAEVRAAISASLGKDVLGPEPFKPRIPF